MITKTGIEYSENSDLSNSSTIEENGTVNSITIPDWKLGVDLYCRAYVIEDDTRIKSSIEHYLPMNWFYLKNEYAGQNMITFTRTISSHGILYYYSFDKFNWTQVPFVWDSGNKTGVFTMTFEAGEKVYLKSSNDNVYSCDLNITCSEKYSIGGDIRKSIIGNSLNKFSRLFMNSITLIDASDLVLSYTGNLSLFGFKETFRGCSNLRRAPDFSQIKAISSYGLYHTFEGTSIETINMNSVELIGACGMECTFKNSQLQSIQMDNLVNNFKMEDRGKILYQAFYGCTNLEKGIDLSNFEETNTPEAPDLFKEMYYGCTNLYEATAPKKITNSNNNSIITNWLQGAGGNVIGTKTVYCPTGVTVPTGNSGVPSGWTRVDY